MGKSVKYNVLAFVLVVLSSVLYYLCGYLVPRSEFALFFGVYILLFACFYWLWQNRQAFTFRHFLFLALLFRLILLFAIPSLSNDFYRFFWDGELIAQGINPFAHTPDELISFTGFYDQPYMRLLYHGMGELSQQHYSCYPPLNQLAFLLASSVSDSVTVNLLVLKGMIVAFDLGAILVGRKILEQLGMDVHRIWLYALNPFVILEFTGNVHFEGVMIFFLLCSILTLMKNQWLFSAAFMALAIQVKLVPLLLIPFVFKKLKWRKTIGYLAMTTLILLLTGMILLNGTFLGNMLSSIRDYFVAFEFNAGIFYLVRAMGFAVKGYDIVATAGPVLSFLSLGAILLLALLRSFKTDRDLFAGMLFGLTIYYAFATTVHPWYIGMILVLSVFTPYRFGLVWSLLVMLSYSAYDGLVFAEKPVFLWTEYLLLAAVMIYEIRQYTTKSAVGMDLKAFFRSDQ